MHSIYKYTYVYICIFIYIFTFKYIHMYARSHTRTHTHATWLIVCVCDSWCVYRYVHICMYVYKYMSIYDMTHFVCICISTYICMYVYTFPFMTWLFVCLCMSIYVCMYVRIYIYAHLWHDSFVSSLFTTTRPFLSRSTVTLSDYTCKWVMSHAWMGYDAFMRGKWLIHTCKMTRVPWCVILGTWLIHMTHSHMCNTREMTHSHDLFTYV